MLDWELCTLGDPLADVGLLMVYWSRGGRRPDPAVRPAHARPPGFPARAELRERYAERSGRDLSEIDFYVALGYWKLAIILQGVYARYAAGGYGESGATDASFEQFAGTSSSASPRRPTRPSGRLG